MLLTEKELIIPRIKDHKNLLEHISDSVSSQLGSDEIPVRIAISRTDNK